VSQRLQYTPGVGEVPFTLLTGPGTSGEGKGLGLLGSVVLIGSTPSGGAGLGLVLLATRSARVAGTDDVADVALAAAWHTLTVTVQ
jgi:hypothetical protein